MKRLYVLLTSWFIYTGLNSSAQTIITIAGKFNTNAVTATSIGINPRNPVIDAAGNIYIADPDKHVVRKMSTSGIITTIAGTGTYGSSGDGGVATSAQLENPYNIAIDASGNIYIADSYDNRIRKVTTNGIITTVAGDGTAGFSGDGGRALNAQFDDPVAIAVDAAGNIFIADFNNNRIRKVDTSGAVSTVAGNGNFGFSGDGGPATSAELYNPTGIAVDATGNLFISDSFNECIRKVTTGGIITTIAGNGNFGFSGDGGPATSAWLSTVSGSVAIDAAGNIFIPDAFNHRIRKVTTNGIITTIAGNGGNGFGGDGSSATAAQIFYPTGVCTDATGNVYISSDYRIRKISASGVINTIAGNGTGGVSGDQGPALSAQLYRPDNAVADAAGNLYITDESDHRIRKIDVNGIINTFAGNGSKGFSGDGGLASSAQFYSPTGVATDDTGNVYIADTYNYRIRKVTTNGIVTTIAGNGTQGYSGDGGPALSAAIGLTSRLTLDATGNIYFADRFNNRIRKISTEGIITTVAGNGTAGFTGDGGMAISAQLHHPSGVAVDASGNLFISDALNNRIRKVSAGGIISTIAGNGTAGYSGDGGSALAAQLYGPGALTVDAAGNVLFTDVSDRIRKITTSGTILTIAGGGIDASEGVAATAAHLYITSSVSLDASGNLYIAEYGNNRVRKVTASALPLHLQEFKTALDVRNIVCSWRTSEEINSRGFLVQRSMDGTSFTTIGMIAARGAGAGLVSSYTFTDYNAADQPVQRLYYRLEMTDQDGKKTYSAVSQVRLHEQGFLFSLTPNPAHGSVQVNGEGIKRIQLSDFNGKIVKRLVATSSKTVMNLSGLQKGVYTIQVMYVDGSTRSEKLAIQ